MKDQGKDGHDDHAAAQAGERPEQPGERRRQQHRAGKFDQTHLIAYPAATTSSLPTLRSSTNP